MNIKISQKDLNALKIRDAEEGMPYQTLVFSIIHKYLSNSLVERKKGYEVQEVKPGLRKSLTAMPLPKESLREKTRSI